MTASAARPRRYAVRVLDGFPRGMTTPGTEDRLGRFCIELDVLGRLDPLDGSPYVEEHSLAALIRASAGPLVAKRLMALLRSGAGCAFAPGPLPALEEVAWLDLAEAVSIYDPTPEARLADLGDQAPTTVAELARAVCRRFPSLEEELVQPPQLARRIETLLLTEGPDEMFLRTVHRQLGWWAAVAAVLLLPVALLTRDAPTASGTGDASAWPLGMFLLTSGLGGWTLTVVGGCALAPIPGE